MPSVAELKTEIETGPLAAACAPFWAQVFPTEPEPAQDSPARARWDRIKFRFGTLEPDGAFGVLAVLNDPARGRTRLEPIRVSAFAQFAAARGFLVNVQTTAADAGANASIRNICALLMLTIQGASDRSIDPNDAPTVDMIDALVAAGVASADDKAALLAACTVPCSRLDELGWQNVTIEAVQAAKGA